MPNWCSNNLYIKGNTTDLQDFINKVEVVKEDSDLKHYDILQSLYPCPQELRDTTAGSYSPEPHQNWANLLASGEITQDWYDQLVQRNADGWAKNQENMARFGYKDWYDWCCSKWGTKWGDCDTELLSSIVEGEDSQTIEFSFSSAWAPPMDGIAHIATMFPTLKFAIAYCEEGMDFYGFSMFSEDGSYDDDCRNMTDLKGYADIDWENDDEAFEKAQEIIIEGRDALIEESGFFTKV